MIICSKTNLLAACVSLGLLPVLYGNALADDCEEGQRYTFPKCASAKTDTIGDQQIVSVSNSCGWPIVVRVDLELWFDEVATVENGITNIQVADRTIRAVRCCQLMMAPPAHCGHPVPDR